MYTGYTGRISCLLARFASLKHLDRLLAVVFGLSIVVSFMRIHFRVQTTVIGYEVASLKDHETKLLEENSHLKMELSKMTRQDTLVELAQIATP